MVSERWHDADRRSVAMSWRSSRSAVRGCSATSKGIPLAAATAASPAKMPRRRSSRSVFSARWTVASAYRRRSRPNSLGASVARATGRWRTSSSTTVLPAMKTPPIDTLGCKVGNGARRRSEEIRSQVVDEDPVQLFRHRHVPRAQPGLYMADARSPWFEPPERPQGPSSCRPRRAPRPAARQRAPARPQR